MDWNDEPSVIDAFVDAVHADNPYGANIAGARLLEQASQGWEQVASGTTLLRLDKVPMPEVSPWAGLGHVGKEELEPFVTAERYEQLLADENQGESLTPEEVQIWRKLESEEILNDNPDFDAYPAWSVRRVTHSDGRVAFLAQIGGGDSYSEPWNECVCGAKSEEDALAGLREVGFISVEDFRARWKPDPPKRKTATRRRRRPAADA
ncbi:MAG: hypothetical protein ACR2NO_01650 [Chloroflexota bacterium]